MTHRRPITLAAALAAAALSACGGSSSGSATGPAKISVRLVDTSAAAMASDPTSAYEEVNIDILRVEIWSEAQGWQTLATPTCSNRPPGVPLDSPGCIVNLLDLTFDGTKGVLATLADGKTIPEGRYGQMRLLLGEYNSVKLPHDPEYKTLKVPSGEQTGVKLIVNFEVQAGTTKDVYIDFLAHRSVLVHGAGKSGKYILRPTVRAFDLLETGTIHGKLTDKAGNGLPGVPVTAQTIAGDTPAVALDTLTSTDPDKAGEYQFTFVPRGVTYHVVAQPVVAGAAQEGPLTTVYEAKASPALTITPAAPIATWSSSFATVQSGTLQADLNVAATPFQPFDATVFVRASLVPDDGSATVTVQLREAGANVSQAPTAVTFTDLPAATYQVLAVRDLNGSPAQVSASVTVPASGTGTATLEMPVQ